eukprot:UN02597
MEIQQFKAQKNQKHKIEIYKQTIHKLKSEISKMRKERYEMTELYNDAVEEIQILKQKESSFNLSQNNCMKKLRHSKKEILNIKRRLKLALSDMDKQSKYYEQQIRKTELNTHVIMSPVPPRISLLNDTSKIIEMEWNKCNELFVNVKQSKMPSISIQKSVTSPTAVKYDNIGMLSSPTPSAPSPAACEVITRCSPNEAYKLYVDRMNCKENQTNTPVLVRPKLIK